MKAWDGFLPILFLVSASLASEPEGKTNASRLANDALASEAAWADFPGFTADLEIEWNGTVCRGRVIVEPSGGVSVEQVSGDPRAWAVRKIGCIVQQRLPQDHAANDNWTFLRFPAKPEPFGQAVCRTDAPFSPCLWVRDQHLQAVEVRSFKHRLRTTALRSECTLDRKNLPVIEVLHQWNARTSELEATETTLLSWRRVGRLDLPATVQVLAAGATADPKTPAYGRIVLTHHRLFPAPDGILASR